MKVLIQAALCCVLGTTLVHAQKPKKASSSPTLPEFNLKVEEVGKHVRFLAADEMLGRRTGEITNNVAARYIAEQYRSLGLKPAGSDYLQSVALEKVSPGNRGYLTYGADTLKVKQHFISFSGEPATFNNVPVVFAAYGTENDYQGLDVKGKIVVAQFGTADAKSPMQGFETAEQKTKWATDRGAVGLIEVLPPQLPWQTVANYFGREQVRVATESNKKSQIPHLWLGGAASKGFNRDQVKQLSGQTPSQDKKPIRSYNVAAVLEGTDPVLKNEYVILSAHFDHVGTGKNGGGNFTEADSIFNGTRDNAFGTAAVLEAASTLSKVKPKRSILFLNFTGEELGLLGSKYYAEHPLVPMKSCIYNLNCDGAGYNDTTLVTVIGLERTGTQAEFETAAKAFGLKVNADPAPEQGLFDRSDNVNFAAKGIPAPTIAPGFTKFDADLFKFYHQVTDNPDSISYPYLLKYCQTYAYVARLIANRATRPQWVKGDKYEAASQALYGK
ncbi:peptidase M28 [Siphonobacter sp. BAB-5385]|uniref:M28 family peptidase n=1 Tax=unclassified Siphonobacter TaxID=2635712 RepID=UPI000B9DE727|nr:MULTISPECIES: M28 family peptidase [unclassified Siphonobacter]OZI09422.1 peptidase M28 [Siphonobacter sp. BAB-5385]PMD92066.1 peptidase M28 [Siphonobacter sp. BAB-5405]